MSVITIVLVSAFILCLVSAISGKCPLWVSVLLLCIAGLLQAFGR